jgi:hypothetical protein
MSLQWRETKLVSRQMFCCTKAGCNGLVSSHSTSSYESCGMCQDAHCMTCHQTMVKHGTHITPAVCQAAKEKMLDDVYRELADDLPADAKTCPCCLRAVFKDQAKEECNSMACPSCSCRFCWLCGTVTVTPEEFFGAPREASSLGHAHFVQDPEDTYGVRPAGWYDKVRERQRPQCLQTLGMVRPEGGRANMMWWVAPPEHPDERHCAPWPGVPALYTKPPRDEVEKIMFGAPA